MREIGYKIRMVVLKMLMVIDVFKEKKELNKVQKTPYEQFEEDEQRKEAVGKIAYILKNAEIEDKELASPIPYVALLIATVLCFVCGNAMANSFWENHPGVASLSGPALIPYFIGGLLLMVLMGESFISISDLIRHHRVYKPSYKISTLSQAFVFTYLSAMCLTARDDFGLGIFVVLSVILFIAGAIPMLLAVNGIREW